MQIIIHQNKLLKIAEIVSDTIFLNALEDGLDLLRNIYYDQFDSIILHQENISPLFFNLKTGLAGEILQKFSNYRMRLVIVGDYSQYKSKSLQDFIFESNKGKLINFLPTKEAALEALVRLALVRKHFFYNMR
ncbi:MAG TPA: DUF4180 domain-containing protein [Saprospiraceae bacterium]|nr:DUF4180 domain-containing protein [Saprospiraceae bacterium]